MIMVPVSWSGATCPLVNVTILFALLASGVLGAESTVGGDDAQRLAVLRAAHAEGRLTLQHPQAGVLSQMLRRSTDPTLRLGAAYLSGLLLVEAGHIDQGVAIWRQANETARQSDGAGWADLRVALGRLEWSQARYYQALVLLEPVVQGMPRTDQAIEAAYLCGRVHLAEGHLPQAVNAFDWARKQAAILHTEPQAVYGFWNALQTGLRTASNPENAQRLFREAEGSRKNSQWETARGRYQRVVSEYAESPEVPPSRWALGACLLGEGMVQEAWQHWRAFADDEPLAPYRGQALVSMGDVHLEHRFKIEEARTAYQEVIDRLATLRDGRNPGDIHGSWRGAAYQAHLRMGLLAFIRDDREAAQAAFQESRPYAPPRQPVLTGLEPMPTPVERLIEYCQSGRELTPRPVMQGRGKEQIAALMCFLSDFYMLSQDPGRARSLLGRVANDRSVQASTVQRAYASFRLAEAYYELEQFDDFYRQLEAYLRDHVGQPWTPDVLMRKGVAEYSRHKLPEQALATFRQVADRHPNHELAPASLWYMATICDWQGRDEEALLIYRLLNRRYPKNGFRSYIEDDLIPKIQARSRGRP